MISLDYDDTLQAAAGYQVEEIRKKIMKDYKGQYLLAVEGNAPTKDGGVYCTIGGETFLEILKETAARGQGRGRVGLLRLQRLRAERPAPIPPARNRSTRLITGKPIINVPGCPPIAEVMTGVLTYILTFDRLPELDRVGRPKMFYGQRIHDKCYRRPFFDAGQFVETWDDDGAQKGWCLYKMGCRGPVHLQLLLHHQVEQRRLVPHRLGPRLHRLQRGELLGQRPLLRAAVQHPRPGHRVHAGPDRQDARRRRRSAAWRPHYAACWSKAHRAGRGTKPGGEGPEARLSEVQTMANSES